MKTWWQSKTIWAALLTGILAGVNYFQEYVTDPGILSILGVVIAFIMWLLRLLTDKPVGPAGRGGFTLLLTAALISNANTLEAQTPQNGFAFVTQPKLGTISPAATLTLFSVPTNWTAAWAPDAFGAQALLAYNDPSLQIGADLHFDWWIARTENLNVDFFFGVAYVGKFETLSLKDFGEKLGISVGLRLF